MQISELARVAGVSVPTVKYYLREGLLPPGTATSATRADYDDRHVLRLRLIRALVEVGRLPINRVRDIVAVLESPPASWHALLGSVHGALASAHGVESGVLGTAVVGTAAVGTGVVGRGVAEPAVAEPAVAEPAVAEPAIAEPAVAEPAVAEPAIAEPDVVNPGADAGPADVGERFGGPSPTAGTAARSRATVAPPDCSGRDAAGSVAAAPGPPARTGSESAVSPQRESLPARPTDSSTRDAPDSRPTGARAGDEDDVTPSPVDVVRSADAAVARLGWHVHPGAPARAQLQRALDGVAAVGLPMTLDLLRAYGSAALQVAEADVASVPTSSAASAARHVVIGTVLYEPVLLALRRLAQEDASARRFGDPSTGAPVQPGTTSLAAGG